MICSKFQIICINVSKGAKIRNRYNQVPHLTQETNRKVTNSQLDTTNDRQEVSLFPAGDHKAHINRPAQRHSKHKTEKTYLNKTYGERSGSVVECLTRALGGRGFEPHRRHCFGSLSKSPPPSPITGKYPGRPVPT